LKFSEREEVEVEVEAIRIIKGWASPVGWRGHGVQRGEGMQRQSAVFGICSQMGMVDRRCIERCI
jgi:hypothetical protein